MPVDIEQIRITESVIRILMQKKTTSCELRHLLVSCIMTYSWNWHSFSTDHAREKTMSCELRQLLEIYIFTFFIIRIMREKRPCHVSLDIFLKDVMLCQLTLSQNTWYIPISKLHTSYMTTSIFMKTIHLKKNHLHHNHQTICQTSWQESISRCNGFVQVQGGAFNEASEGLEQTI